MQSLSALAYCKGGIRILCIVVVLSMARKHVTPRGGPIPSPLLDLDKQWSPILALRALQRRNPTGVIPKGDFQHTSGVG